MRFIWFVLFAMMITSCRNNSADFADELSAADSLLLKVEQVSGQMNPGRLQYILDMHHQISDDSILFNQIDETRLRRYPISRVYQQYQNILMLVDTGIIAINKLQAETFVTAEYINDLKQQVSQENIQKKDFYDALTAEESLLVDLDERVNHLFMNIEDEIALYIKMGESLEALRNEYLPPNNEEDESEPYQQ